MASNIDALVIADHNSHEGIDLARTALSELREAQDPRFREICLFPGVEITTAGGLHLLGVFDPAESSEAINGLLHKCEFLGERGTSNRTTAKSFIEVMRLICASGGVAIPAHVDGPAGILKCMAPNELASLAEEKLVTAVEVSGDDAAPATRRGWIAVLGSDAHHLDANGAPDASAAKFPGSHFTWVKMETPNIAGLRAALSDGQASLIRSATSTANPNVVSHNAIRSIRIRQGESEAVYEFGPWMNALIGGRGTGKSTLIEVLRLVMSRFDELPATLQSDLLWFSPTPGQLGTRMWDVETEIDVEYARPNALYRICWRGAEPTSARIEVYGDEGWRLEQGSVFERFPVLVSSQKQIFEMAKQPQALLTLVDSLPEVDHAGWEREYEELRNKYRTTCSSIASLRQRLAGESIVQGNLIDAEQLVEGLAALRSSPEVKELDRLLAEGRAQGKFDEAALGLGVSVNADLATFDHTTADIALADPSDSVESAWRELVVQSVSDLRAAALALGTGQETYRAARLMANPRTEEIERIRDILCPAPDAQVANCEDPAAQRDSTRELEPDARDDAYEAARERLDGLRATVAQMELQKAELARLETVATELLGQVGASRDELHRRRRSALAGLSAETVELRLFQFADASRLESDLRMITRRPTGFDSLFDKDGLRRLLHDPRNPSYPKDLTSLKSLLKDLRCDGRDCTARYGISNLTVDPRFVSHLQGLDEFEFHVALDLWFPEDYLEVRYSDTPSAPKKSISQGSPGQRTAALLAVMLRLGDQPLVLDQPEDDIDNLLIYQLVVRTLKEVKARRQVIVATHNANIVVNGDAEHVTILENGTIPKIAASGAIQDDAVRNLICRVMEGGEIAFHARYRRLFHES
jgi:energy-coupling factor transporter ATP-binding protein EcfA2